jgi:hypothetical protein
MGFKNVDQTSFINLFPEISDENNIKLLDIWNSFRIRIIPEIYNSDAFIEYTPRSNDTLYMLSYAFYGNTKLWWLIPLVNDAEDPFDYIQNVADNGGTIKILKNDYVAGILFTAARLKNAKDNG